MVTVVMLSWKEATPRRDEFIYDIFPAIPWGRLHKVPGRKKFLYLAPKAFDLYFHTLVTF